MHYPKPRFVRLPYVHLLHRQFGLSQKAAAKKPSATPAKKMTAEEAAELPVLTQPYSMFLDMIKNTPQIADVAKRLAGARRLAACRGNCANNVRVIVHASR